MGTSQDLPTHDVSIRGQRYILIIHFYVESGQKMIQFNIQFKVETFNSENIQFKIEQKYSLKKIFKLHTSNTEDMRQKIQTSIGKI